MLKELFGSQGRAEILKHLFTSECRSIHLRELSRLSGVSAPSLQRELRQLVKLRLVNAERDGNRVNYCANRQSPIFALLCELVLKTEGAVGKLRAEFENLPAEIIFIFGSVANGTASPDSDIDLFVIGDCGLREVTRRIHAVASEIGQEINPYIVTRIEYQERIRNHDHFLNEVSASAKIFLKGDADEFTRLAE